MAPDPVSMASLAAGGAALAAGAGVVLAERLRRKLVPADAETFLKDTLPFDRMEPDGMTLRCRNGGLSRVLELGGLNPDSLNRDLLEGLFSRRMNWLRYMADEGMAFRIITIREGASRALPASYPEPVLQEIHERWMSRFSDTFDNRHYIVLCEHPRRPGLADRVRAGIEGDLLPAAAHRGKLDLAVEATMDYLHDYSPRLLGVGEGPDSPLLGFWSTLLHGESRQVGAWQDHLSDRLVGCDIAFDGETGRIVWQDGSRKWYGAIVSLNRWGDETSSRLMTELGSLPGRLVFLRWLKGWPKATAQLHLEDQKRQRNLLSGLLPNSRVEEEFTVAARLVGDDDSSFFTTQFSILVLGDGEEELEALVDQVRRTCLGHGHVTVRERACLEYAWRSLFPHSVLPGSGVSRVEGILRPSHLLSHNLAHLLDFSRESGGIAACDWGEGPIRWFRTASGSSYSLQLHETGEKEALAHALVIAPAGSGKTTLFQHLMGGALRHQNLRAFVFDRFNGTRIFTQSIGGSYVDLSDPVNGDVCLNPFCCEDTPAERAFLARFLGYLGGFDPGHRGGEEARADCRRAVDMIMRMPREERVLDRLHTHLFNRHSPLHAGIAPWVGRGERAHWFNGMRDGKAFDALDFEGSRLAAFDLTTVLDSVTETGALMGYLLHRIRRTLVGTATPHMIFIDETAPVLKSDLADIIAVWLREQRKLRGSISLCFQDVGDLVRSPISSIILKQCTTRFLFPNASATREEYGVFGLTEAEMAYIRGETRVSRMLPRSVLVKKSPAGGGGESVILDIDMSPLGPCLKLYKSGSESVRLVHELQQQWGKKWIDPYLHAA